MKPDLYAVLGVKPNAKPDGIRRAYRKLARKYHPDSNPGDVTVSDKYHAVAHAYAILANPETRKRYDETGNDEIPRDTELSDLASILIPAFMEIMSGYINNPYAGDIKTTDMVASILQKIRTRRGAVKSQLESFKTSREKMRVVLGRFTVPNGENLFESAIRAELEKIEQPIKMGTVELERIVRALDYMKTVKYRTDARPGSSSSSAAMGDLAGMLGMVAPRIIFTTHPGGV